MADSMIIRAEDDDPLTLLRLAKEHDYALYDAITRDAARSMMWRHLEAGKVKSAQLPFKWLCWK